MIVATAGHVDHGKTTLVKALTGVDTDRLPHEKARGISIDIGFAHWKTPEGAQVSFVDVPGHERYVSNMLAGICCVDFAMLVLAADDGVMPQTREHLAIVDLLAVGHGIVVITKADRVDGLQLARVERDSRALLKGTSLELAPVLPVSAFTGMGMDALRVALAGAAGSARRRTTVGRRMRYAVDRVFTVAGSGTVVTGTVVDGVVGPGERLVLSPGGHAVRIRGIQKYGSKAESAHAGERCALNLAGIDRALVRRGDWVVHPQQHVATSRLDVELRAWSGHQQALRHWTAVHLHLGTRDLTARVSLRRGEALEPGRSGFARLVLDQPIAAARGDRFILRDHSAQHTLAGGRVLDASPAPRRATYAMHMLRMQALAHPSATHALQSLVECTPQGVNAHALARNFNLDPDAMAGLMRQTGLCSVGSGEDTFLFTQAHVQARHASVVVQAEPENPEHVRLWQLAVPVLRRAGRAGLNLTQLAESIRAKEPVLRDMLYRKAKDGEAVRVGVDRFYLHATMAEFEEVARRVALAAADHRFTVGRFRDAAGVGRALAVQVLETLDRLGVTLRVADERVLRDSTRQASSHLRFKENH